MLVQLNQWTAVDPNEVIRIDDDGMARGIKVYMRDGSVVKTGGTVTEVVEKLNTLPTAT